MENIKTRKQEIPENTLEWRAYEHEYTEKSTDWFWAVGIITIALTTTAIILDNILFGFLIIVGTFALVIQSVKKPKELVYQITNEGIFLGPVLYKYDTLESFWIVNGEKKLILKSKKLLVPYIIIKIGDMPAYAENTLEEQIYNKLSKYLKAEEMYEPLSQKIMEKLGF